MPPGDSPPPSPQTTIGLPGRPSVRHPVPPHIADYRFIKVIGRGAFGTVWLAEETLAGVFRAIKVLDQSSQHPGAMPEVEPPSPAPAAQGTGHSEEVRGVEHSEIASAAGSAAASRAEIELAGLHAFQSRAQGHAHLVQILKTGLCEFDGRHTVYYVMEIADHAGGPQPFRPQDYEPLTLAVMLRRPGRLPLDEVLRYAGQLLDAIDHLHQAGLQHRDVKPSNVVFVKGELKLADLGLASTASLDSIGTPDYMPPEGKPDDLYAFGKVLYEMATGLPASAFPEWPVPARRTRRVIAMLMASINTMAHPDPTRRARTAARTRQLVGVCEQRAYRGKTFAGYTLLTAGTILAFGVLAGGILAMAYVGASDPFQARNARAANDGTQGFVQLDSVGGGAYKLIRMHIPGAARTLGNPEYTKAIIDDVQTELRDGVLVVAGRYQIINRKNPVSGRADEPHGEIDQLLLSVGDHAIVLYHGQPGATPGVRGRFVRGIRLEELDRTYSRFYPIEIGFMQANSPEEAVHDYSEARQSRPTTHTYQIGEIGVPAK